MRRSKSTDDISVIVLFFHVAKHNRTNDAFLGELDEPLAQSEDELPPEDSPTQRLARSHSEVSMSLYLSRQSQRDSARASVHEMFPRTPDEVHEMRLPSVGRDGVSMVDARPAPL